MFSFYKLRAIHELQKGKIFSKHSSKPDAVRGKFHNIFWNSFRFKLKSSQQFQAFLGNSKIYIAEGSSTNDVRKYWKFSASPLPPLPIIFLHSIALFVRLPFRSLLSPKYCHWHHFDIIGDSCEKISNHVHSFCKHLEFHCNTKLLNASYFQARSQGGEMCVQLPSPPIHSNHTWKCPFENLTYAAA